MILRQRSSDVNKEPMTSEWSLRENSLHLVTTLEKCQRDALHREQDVNTHYFPSFCIDNARWQFHWREVPKSTSHKPVGVCGCMWAYAGVWKVLCVICRFRRESKQKNGLLALEQIPLHFHFVDIATGCYWCFFCKIENTLSPKSQIPVFLVWQSLLCSPRNQNQLEATDSTEMGIDTSLL